MGGTVWALLDVRCLWTSVSQQKGCRLLDTGVELRERTVLKEFGVRSWGSAKESRSLLRVLVLLLLACDPASPFIFLSFSFSICKMGPRKPSSQAIMRTDEDGLHQPGSTVEVLEDSGEVNQQG